MRDFVNTEAAERIDPTGDVVCRPHPGPWSHRALRWSPSGRRGGRGTSLAVTDGGTDSDHRVLCHQMATANSNTGTAGPGLAARRRPGGGRPRLPPRALANPADPYQRLNSGYSSGTSADAEPVPRLLPRL